jgi:hypothetical protein
LLGVLNGLKFCGDCRGQRVVHTGRTLDPHHCPETLNPLWLVTLHDGQQGCRTEVPEKNPKSHFSWAIRVELMGIYSVRRDWMTIGTAVALVVAAALLIFVLLPQATSNDLSADGGSTATSHPTSSDRS